MKHRLKMIVRQLWARFVFHTGLHLLLTRLMPRRLTILTSHCIEHPSNRVLPAEMKIKAETIERLLERFGRHYDWVNVGEGWRRLQSGGGRSMLALAMDDGYHDNLELLLPILERRGLSATVYLESRPLAGRELNWTHKFFWLLGRMTHTEWVESYRAKSTDKGTVLRLEQVLAAGGRLEYSLKKVLKYEAAQPEVEATLTAMFLAAGGDEAALCAELYLSWEDARALEAGGVELGGHTVHHWVLSGLSAEEQRREVSEGKECLARELKPQTSFAYPFGRHWDWNAASLEAVRGAGFRTAVTTHAGSNTRDSDPLRLARWMIDDHTPQHLLACEACGGFELLRKLGIDLSE